MSGGKREKNPITPTSVDDSTVAARNKISDWSPSDPEDVVDMRPISPLRSSSAHAPSDIGVTSPKMHSETEFRSAVLAVQESLAAIQNILLEHQDVLDSNE